LLLDIHGQHDQQSLLSSRVQLELVDSFGGLADLREAFETAYTHWQEQQKVLEQIRNQSKDRISREEFLRHECEELTIANIELGEEEVLLREHRRLQNSDKLSELSNQAYLLLHEEDHSLLSQLDSLVRVVRDLEKTDLLAKPWLDMLEETHAQLEELAYTCRQYRDESEHDPARLEKIDERLALLQRLKKKYHESLEGLMVRRETVQAELEELTNLDCRLDYSEREVAAANQQVLAKAQTLSQARQKVARKLEERVKVELSALKMSHTQFEIGFREYSNESTIGSLGLDRVEYLFCANPGEALQPLNRVASGGELSRLMLAIKTVLADVDQIPVLVFDEIDTGVGGDVAAGMGQRLRVLGKSHQVLCLTHLPQIASKGTQHFLVEKRVEKKRTATIVRPLSETARKREIARMLGGERFTAAVEKAAAEMLNASKEVSR
jgi:DNA repair protein RecN (Recombination protein N)